MADERRQGATEPPEYNVYRSRRVRVPRPRTPDLSDLRDRGRKPGDGGGRDRARRPRPGLRRALKWLLLAALGWILLSFLAFAVSAQIQSMRLSGEAKSVLQGGPMMLFSPQTILVIGTDARPPGAAEPGAGSTEECYEQQERGEAPHGNCTPGQFRADTLMLIRAGGGTFRKLSIPRDVYAPIPGQSPQKINAAYSFGGAKAQIEAVSDYLDTEIDHVAIVDFNGFEDLIDAVGGIVVDVPTKLCADIAGGAGGGQGGWTLRVGKGKNTLNGEKALTYARIRKPSECPGVGASAYTLGYDDLDRARAQQQVISGIKDRLTDPLRIPYNFIHGPSIGWNAPKAFVSDMGFFAMPQLVLAAGIGGDAEADVLCRELAESGCVEGPEGRIEVPESERRRAVDQLLDG